MSNCLHLFTVCHSSVISVIKSNMVLDAILGDHFVTPAKKPKKQKGKCTSPKAVILMSDMWKFSVVIVVLVVFLS